MSKKELNTVKIAGLNLISTSEERLLGFLASRITRGQKTFVVTPNPEFLVFARHNPWFKKILNKADVAIPDGIGLVWASRFLAPRAKQKGLTSRPVIKERISGTDLMEGLCKEAAGRGWKVYLVGGKPGVAKKTLTVLKKRFPGLQGWAKSGPKLELVTNHWSPITEKKITNKIIQEINAKEPNLLFVAFGMGKQEKFIWDNWEKLNVKLAMGVGGAFDYLSGTIPRPPKWSRKVGLEWLYRLLRQPWRWKRQLALIEFVWLVIKEKVSSMI